MEILYVPAGGTGRYQVNDTHLHKPMKGYAQNLAAKWYTRNVVALNRLRYPQDTSPVPHWHERIHPFPIHTSTLPLPRLQPLVSGLSSPISNTPL